MHPEQDAIPRSVREALAPVVLVPANAACERYPLPDAQVECLVCIQPVKRKNADESLCMVVVCGRPEATQQFVAQVSALLQAAALNMPSLRHMPCSAGEVLLAPWIFRGEFRAATVAAAAPREKAVERLLLSTLGPGMGSELQVGGKDLRTLLMDFVGEVQPLGRKLKRFLVGRQTSNYVFPLGCSVNEARTSSGVVWSVNFKDMELVERAEVATQSWLITRKPRCISQTDMVSSADVDDSLLSEITLWAESSSLESRQEMARLIKHLLMSLDQFSFNSDLEGEDLEGEAVAS
jgi:hypothetical protein